MSTYTELGYENRLDYLKTLSKDYEVPYKVVVMMATMLGSNEDFDGLLTMIEDYAEKHNF